MLRILALLCCFLLCSCASAPKRASLEQKSDDGSMTVDNTSVTGLSSSDARITNTSLGSGVMKDDSGNMEVEK